MKKNNEEQVKNSSGAETEDHLKGPDGVDDGMQAPNAQDTAACEEPADGESKPVGETSDPSVRIGELEKQNADLQDQYLRKAADFDNYRKRMIREKQEAIDYANTTLLLDLVQILDDFDRAIDAGSAGDQGELGAFADGISMIRKQMGSLLESKYGLVYYPAKDTVFDPNIHEAIGTVPDPEVQEPTVAEEYLKGYKLKERVIRPAKVMVKMPQNTAAE